MSSPQQAFTYIVIVNWNGWRDTLECLESLFHLDGDAYRIIVCDNGSKDDSIHHILEWAAGRLEVSDISPSYNPIKHASVQKPISCDLLDIDDLHRPTDSKLILIDCKENLGFAGACNAGIRFAEAQGNMTHVWLLNNDTVVPPDSLSKLLEKSRSNPKAGIIGSTIIYYHNPSRVQAFGGARYFQCIGLAMHIGRFRPELRAVDEDAIAKKLDYVMGASMLVTREFLDIVGPMEEDYFLYYEELDWALRGRPRFSLAYAHKSRVYHKAGASIGSSRKSSERSLLSDSYLMRNRLKITRRFFPRCMWSVRLFLLVEILSRFLHGRYRHAKAILKIALEK